jgi:hypothetical protein
MSTRPPLITRPKVQRSDRAANVSSSWAGSGIFPEVHEMGMKVLRDEVGLVPVE